MWSSTFAFILLTLTFRMIPFNSFKLQPTVRDVFLRWIVIYYHREPIFLYSHMSLGTWVISKRWLLCQHKHQNANMFSNWYFSFIRVNVLCGTFRLCRSVMLGYWENFNIFLERLNQISIIPIEVGWGFYTIFLPQLIIFKVFEVLHWCEMILAFDHFILF